ncbi:hypothetical protein [Flavobacterium sp. GNP002]
MIKNNQISQGEGGILDLKINSWENVGFSIRGIGASTDNLESFERIVKSIEVIHFGMKFNKDRYAFYLSKTLF